MTTSGTKDQRFICKLKMESEIACGHTVNLTATPNLVIDKAGVVGTSLTYTFAAGSGLVAQDIGVLGTECGDGKIFANITSPYFVTPNGLKVKRDEIDITIDCLDPDGWRGLDHGLRWGGYGNPTPADSYWSEPDLNYKYTHVGAPALVQFAVSDVTPDQGGNTFLGIIGVGATYKDMFGRWIATEGVSRFYVYYDGKYEHNSAVSLGTVTVTIYLPNSTNFPKTFPRRGELNLDGQPAKAVHRGAGSFTESFGGLLEAYKPAAAKSLKPTPYSVGNVTSVTYSGTEFIVTGILDPGGSCYAAPYIRFALPQGGYINSGAQIFVVNP